jgi:hypothetical protein
MLDHQALQSLAQLERRASLGAVPMTPRPWWQNFWVLGGAAIGAFWGFEEGDPKAYGEASASGLGIRLGAAAIGTGLGVLGGLGAKKLLSTEA